MVDVKRRFPAVDQRLNPGWSNQSMQRSRWAVKQDLSLCDAMLVVVIQAGRVVSLGYQKSLSARHEDGVGYKLDVSCNDYVRYGWEEVRKHRDPTS